MTASASASGRVKALLRASAERPRTVAAIGFVLSRVLYRVLGGFKLDPSPLYYFLQFLDPSYLETDLTRSVLSLHHQGPLLNLLVGLSLKLFGRGAFVALDFVFLALGLGAAIATADVVARLTSRPVLAALGAISWSASPITVLYESWLFYPHVVASLAVIGAALLLRFVRERTVASGVWFFSVLALIGLTRSTYGALWVGAVAVLLALVRALPPKTLAKAAAIPVLVLALNAAKTKAYTGHGYGDAMLWPNLSRKVFQELPRGERTRIVKLGLVSPAVRVEPFSDLDQMEPIRVPHTKTGIPALDDEHSASGRPNGNAIEYALIAEQYYKPDARYLLSHYPKDYVSGVARVFVDEYPRPAIDDTTLRFSPNYVRLRSVDTAIRRATLTPESGPSIPLAVVLAAAFLFGSGATLLASSRASRTLRAFSAFATLTILYVTLVTVLISWGDFPRYRYEVDALSWILLLVGGASLVDTVKGALDARRARSPSVASAPS
ncbi:MAG: hypothetical protein U0271_14265 [Polyangiaceae bacterium]